MTTIVATRQGIWADTFCTYTVPFKMTKIMRIGGALYAGAGDDLDSVYKFFAWLRGDEPRPKLPKDEQFDVLEVCPDGIFAWSKQLARIQVREDVYAIGSGCQFMMGALHAGASIPAAFEAAARYDPHTRLPIECVSL